MHQWLSRARQQQAETFPVGVKKKKKRKKEGFSSLSVLPLNETGGKLTYQVIVTNIAEGELSVALPPFHCGGLKKKTSSSHLWFV